MTPARLCAHFCWLLVVPGLNPATSKLAMAEESAAPSAAYVAGLVDELNADRFDVRQRAADKLQALADQPTAHPALAAALGRVLLAADAPYEVRAFCEPILARLPPAEDQPALQISADEVDRLLAQIDAQSYGLRAGAAMRLDWAAQRSPELARLVADKLKRRLADATLSSDARHRLVQLRESALVTWLASDPATWPAPTATDQAVQEWIETVASDSVTTLAQQAAERELVDLLVYDPWAPKIEAAVALQLARNDLSPEAIERLNRLYELSRPAMAAEIWMEHSHKVLQYLLVDVPQIPEDLFGGRAPRATHFDRIDDESAHCVSGNSLAPGDYPVGVALPPTHKQSDKKDGRTFHLVNLPNARRRLMYEHQQLKIDETDRLRALSERTTAFFLKRKQCLTEREVAMLRQLDADSVSRFVGPYLLAVDDQPISEPDVFQSGSRSTRHALLCGVLAEVGTHEALPGLVEAGRRGRLPEPSEDLRFYIGWLAAFAIAERDPWPGLDDWLAGLVDTRQPLAAGQDSPPDVGATAAAMLLARHGAAPEEFDLAETHDADLRGLGIPTSRFASPAGRQRVLDWWRHHKERAKPAGA
jgi:hypothetical protein